MAQTPAVSARVAFLEPTGVTDSDSNISSGAVTDIDERVDNPDGNLMVAISNGWNGPGGPTGNNIVFTMADLPSEAAVVTACFLRVRAQVAGAANPDDFTQFVWESLNLGGLGVNWSHLDSTAGGNLVDREILLNGNPFGSGTYTVQQVNDAVIRVRQVNFIRDMGADNMHHDWDAIELEVHYNIFVEPLPQLTHRRTLR